MAQAEVHHVLDLPSFEKPVKLLIVVAPYYKDIADELVAGAKAMIEQAGGTWDLVEVLLGDGEGVGRSQGALRSAAGLAD